MTAYEWLQAQDWDVRYREQEERLKKGVLRRFGKRALDIVASFLGLLVLIIPFLIVVIVIKRDSPGPAFFRQERVGRHGEIFRILKFRTMHPGSDVPGQEITVRDDPRITSSGDFLRRYKIDELPQLVNVLVGEMSLVGVRPEVPAYASIYPEAYRVLLTERPGITDMASLTYRNESDLLSSSSDPHRTFVDEIMPEKLKLSLTYQEEATLWSDLKLILKTVFGR